MCAVLAPLLLPPTVTHIAFWTHSHIFKPTVGWGGEHILVGLALPRCHVHNRSHVYSDISYSKRGHDLYQIHNEENECVFSENAPFCSAALCSSKREREWINGGTSRCSLSRRIEACRAFP